MRTPFSERAETMGLNCLPDSGHYSYTDRYSWIAYRQLQTMDGVIDLETNNQPIPLYAIFTKLADENADGWEYQGYVSDFYQFIGNDVLNEGVRSAIQEVGLPIVTENVFLNGSLTRMRNEIIIQSSKATAEVGDVLPVMVIENGYDGTKAATISFGISTFLNNETVIFSFELGKMRQVHLVNSETEMSSVVTSYMQVFAENITDMITQNFQMRVTEDSMLKTLDLIEKIGKRKREEISGLLAEVNPDENTLPTTWQLFLSIVRYSSFEQNLNVKRLLENAAESVLVIPARMYDVLSRLNE